MAHSSACGRAFSRSFPPDVMGCSVENDGYLSYIKRHDIYSFLWRELMKKSYLLLVSLIVFCGLLFTGCNKTDEEADGTLLAGGDKAGYELEEAEDPFVFGETVIPEYVARSAKEYEKEGNEISFDSMQKFFTLDYTPEYPDSVFTEITSAKTSGKVAVDTTQESESVIPGLRQLTDYVTEYSAVRGHLAVYTPEDGGLEETADEEDIAGVDFAVEDWGPQGRVVAEEQHPTFYVVFSQPVRSLQALSEPSSTSDIMSIEPPLPGVFRWYGTRHLSFECDEPADPSVVYTIKIKSDLRSLSGKLITGPTVFKTEGTPLQVMNIWGGYMEDPYDISDCAYHEATGAFPPYEGKSVIRINYQTTVENLRNELVVKVGNKSVPFTLEPLYNNAFWYWSNPPKFNEDERKTNTFAVTITGNVLHNQEVCISCKATEDNFRSYSTLNPFGVTDVSSVTEWADIKGYPLIIRTTQNPDIKSLIQNISFNFGYTLTEDDISVSSSYGWRKGSPSYRVTLHFPTNLVSSGTEYTMTIKNGLKDIFGQTITQGAQTYAFSTPPDAAYAHFLTSGSVMLEAQYPHKILFEHQNITEGEYTVETVENPLSYYIRGDISNETTDDVDPGKRNLRQFQEIELDDYLTNGYGFVDIDTEILYPERDYWYDTYEDEWHSNYTSVQVTDLGITSRIAINKAVVMVRSLSTNRPVPNAEVRIIRPLNIGSYYYGEEYYRNNYGYTSFSPDDDSNCIIKGTTDENGLCVFTYTKEELDKFSEYSQGLRRQGGINIYVKNGDDRALYTPASHNAWSSNVSSQSPQYALRSQQRTFMFVDRGIYRPGEIVTFRGIDRDQLMGGFAAYRGAYTINSRGAWWGSDYIIDDITGYVSDTGGFYGSFKLPDDLDTGYYYLEYERDGGGTARITFQVANFERVKFETSVTMPDVNYYGGDTVTANVSAEYLAGGSLSGAGYVATWFKEPVEFEPSLPELKDYMFNRVTDPGRVYISNSEGNLSTDGTASVSCVSERITDGNPYQYRAEVAVTDMSNQRISGQAATLVHPALFYVGIKKPQNIAGFAKTNQELEIPYILVNPDGTVISTKDAGLKVSDISYELTYEKWTVVHEQSVDNTIYTRYQQSIETDSTGSVPVQRGGVFTVTPSNAGWYTLKVTGTDNRGNHVSSVYEFYVTGSSSSWYDRYNSQSITLTPDRSQYNPGDTAQILLESALPEGDYLITVEREGIFTEEIRHFDEPTGVIEVPVAGNYVPVVYVSVSSYSQRTETPTYQYGEVDLDKPKGYYGVTPLFVDPNVRSFSVQISCDKPSYRPGETATITFTATKGGQPYAGAELTTMAVDRGVLDLINYHVPNPIDFFYNPDFFLLSVYGGDSRALLMDPVTYSVKNLQGGDADEEKENERKDFRPTAFFEPCLITDENGQATVTFKMPDSLTTYRITAFGVKDDVFCLQEDEIRVQNPINIQQVQPKRLRERDTAECGVLITNLSGEGQDVTVTLEVLSPTEDTEQDKLEGRKTIPGKGFVDGAAQHKVYVASGQSSVVYFDVVAEQQGTINLTYTINSQAINEKLISPIRVEKTFVYETVTMIGSSTDDMTTTNKEQLIIPGYAKEGRGDLKVTLDATRLGLLGSSVNYLFDYPYGCLEQQSSRILPLVAFDDYIDVFGLDSQIADLKGCVTSWTKDWPDYQQSNGGFTYWKDSPYWATSMYVTLRVAHIYALALDRGYSPADIPINVSSMLSYIKSDLDYEKSYYDNLNRSVPAGRTKYHNNFEEAYACYVMSLYGDSRLDSYLNNLTANIATLSIDEMAYISLAWFNKGTADGKAKAADINKQIRPYLQPDERTVTMSEKARAGFYWSWNRREDDVYAIVLRAFVSTNPTDEMVDRLLYTLLRKQSHGYWQSTITTANVLESVYSYIKARNLDQTNYTATATLAGTEIMSEQFLGAGAKPKTLVLPFEEELVSSLEKDKPVSIQFQKDGPGFLYYTVEMKYALPDELQAARDEGIKVEYTLVDVDTGEVMNPADADTAFIKLIDGKTYRVTLRIETTRNREYVAVRSPVPSGAEILDSTLVTTGYVDDYQSASRGANYINHKSVGDNEVQFFWDQLYVGSCTLTYTFRANRRGVYPTPPTQAECMYEPEVFGRSDGYLFCIE